VVRPRAAAVAVALVSLVALLALTGALASRAAYGNFAPWQRPAHLSWCARVYLPSDGPTLTRAEVELRRGQLPGDEPYPVVEVTQVPPLVGRPVLASVTPPQRQRLGVPCAMAIYLQVGPDSYVSYGLSGGP
jgi:hypothetical protein